MIYFRWCNILSHSIPPNNIHQGDASANKIPLRWAGEGGRGEGGKGRLIFAQVVSIARLIVRKPNLSIQYTTNISGSSLFHTQLFQGDTGTNNFAGYNARLIMRPGDNQSYGGKGEGLGICPTPMKCITQLQWS